MHTIVSPKLLESGWLIKIGYTAVGVLGAGGIITVWRRLSTPVQAPFTNSPTSPPAPEASLQTEANRIAREICEWRNQALHNKIPLNILIVGVSRAGKSTLINTLYRILSGDYNATIADVGSNFETARTTTGYDRYELPGNIFLFDMPGLHLEMQRQAEVVESLIKGVKTPLDLDNTDQELVIAQFVAAAQQNANADKANKIDHVIYVVDPVQMERLSGSLSSAEVVRSLNQLHKYAKSRPTLVFSHMDIEGFGEKAQQLKTIFERHLCKERVYCVANYIEKGQQKQETDHVYLQLLLDIITHAKVTRGNQRPS